MHHTSVATLFLVFGACLVWDSKECLAAKSEINCLNATYSWPLGNFSANQEVKMSVETRALGDITYAEGPLNLNYTSMEFMGTSESFADLQVDYDPSFVATSNGDPDYCIQMYVYLENVTAGTLFSFQSDLANLTQPDDTVIEKFEVFLNNGEISVDLGVDGLKSFQADLQPSTWYHLIYERDWTKTDIALHINRDIYIVETFKNSLASKTTKWPGKLKIGGSFDELSPPLSGRVACVQLVPGKEPFPCVDHDVRCHPKNYDTFTSSTSTQTTHIPSTTHTITETLQPTLDAVSSVTPSLSSSNERGNETGISSDSIFKVPERCIHFKLVQDGVSFADAADIIQEGAYDIDQCSLLCLNTPDCKLFAVAQDMVPRCSISYTTNNFSARIGSKIYGIV